MNQFTKLLIVTAFIVPLLSFGEKFEPIFSLENGVKKVTGIQSKAINLEWYHTNEINPISKKENVVPNFPGAYQKFIAQLKKSVPVKRIHLENCGITESVKITVLGEQKVNIKEPYLDFLPVLTENYISTVENGTANKINNSIIEILPLRKDANGNIYRLISFCFSTKYAEIESQNKQATKSYNKKGGFTHTVLSKGKWFKFPISEDGIYKLSFEDIKKLGLDPNSIKFSELSIWGGGSGVLPEFNGTKRDEDLQQIPYFIAGNSGTLNINSDAKIIFYARGPHNITYNSKVKGYTHGLNPYSDTAYIFLSVGADAPRVDFSMQGSVPANGKKIEAGIKFQFHEADNLNEMIKNFKSGKEFLGEEFDKLLEHELSFEIPYQIQDSGVRIRSKIAVRSLIASGLEVSINNGFKFKQSPSPVSLEYLDTYATFDTYDSTVNVNGDNLKLRYTYKKPISTSLAWIDWVEVSQWTRNLFGGGVGNYKFPQAYGDTGMFNIVYEGNFNLKIHVWAVNDFRNPVALKVSPNGNNFSVDFRKSMQNQSLEMMAFNEDEVPSLSNAISVPNQNLHGMDQYNYVIVYHPDFRAQAQKLKEYHDARDKITTVLVTPQQIYNEFSYGRQDVTALRDFLKSLYQRSVVDPSVPDLKYACFFGKASFDYKNKFPKNTNFIPTWQNNEVLEPTSSLATDDYFALLDNNEGRLNGSEQMDIGLGRITAMNQEQADAFINKLYAYSSEKSLRDWRLQTSFVSDDQDYNTYIYNAEDLTKMIETENKILNPDKIYLDAFKQQSTPAGSRYPDVNTAVDNKMNSGTLTFTYIGHGSEKGIGHEKVITEEMVSSWKNLYGLPVFITASCEISRFDDPTLVSFGEKILFQPKGGSIALMSTTRVVFASGNATMTENIFSNNIFDKDGFRPRRLGDIFKLGVNRTGIDQNSVKFILLGDPAMEIGLPIDSVVTETINGIDANSSDIDTIKALSKVTIAGYIKDMRTGKIDETFNGILYPTIYDKSQTYRTLRNDADSYPFDFKLQKNIIYKGQTSVKNGKWSFSFYAPKDISYTFSQGKASYYAQNGVKDAAGESNQFKLGGSTVIGKDLPPVVKLTINDSLFQSGGITNENPILIAKISDDYGINTVGLGIGHEISVWMNGKTPTVMNNYYSANLDDSKSGTVVYPFNNLPEGNYTLRMRAWDISNNYGEDSIKFVIVNSQEITLKKLRNNIVGGEEQTARINFEHNGNDQIVSADVYIYDLSGKLIHIINTNTQLNSSNSKINWNLQNELGGTIAPGIYSYTLVLSNTAGKKTMESKKLIITGTNR